MAFEFLRDLKVDCGRSNAGSSSMKKVSAPLLVSTSARDMITMISLFYLTYCNQFLEIIFYEKMFHLLSLFIKIIITWM